MNARTLSASLLNDGSALSLVTSSRVPVIPQRPKASSSSPSRRQAELASIADQW